MIGIYENFIFKYTQNVPGLASATPGTFFLCHILSSTILCPQNEICTHLHTICTQTNSLTHRKLHPSCRCANISIKIII